MAIQIRVSNDEYARIAGNAKAHDLTLSDFVRKAADSAWLPADPPPTAAEKAELLKPIPPRPEPELTHVRESLEDNPELTKRIKQLEARPNVSPEQARERARKQLGL